ncbi:MAG: YceI family protein [Melioribacteraceae bacterium]|nr:YceI family protein [Melioribacteraceae bacterium]
MKTKSIILVLFLFSTFLMAEEWHVKKTEKNLVKFISSTTVLDFEGVTDKIDGYIYWKGEELFGSENEIYFEVDLNSVETGIGKRDRDMREDVLETDKWPKTSYRGKINKIEKTGNNNQYKVSAIGPMSLHGHEKILPIEALIDISNDEMIVNCDFSVLLKDYEIEAPSLLAFIKVADEIKLHLNFTLQKIMEKNN